MIKNILGLLAMAALAEESNEANLYKEDTVPRPKSKLNSKQRKTKAKNRKKRKLVKKSKRK